MPLFGKRIGGGRRGASREKLPMPAMLSTIENFHMAMVVDLSDTAARLQGDNLPPVDEVVSIKLDCVRTFGVVAWSTGGECGVRFDEPLTKFEFERLRREVRLASLAWRTVHERLALDGWASGMAR